MSLDVDDLVLQSYLDNDAWSDDEDDYGEGEEGDLVREEEEIIDIIQVSKRGKRYVVLDLLSST